MEDSRRGQLKKLHERWLRTVEVESTEKTRAECRIILDYWLGEEYENNAYQQYFIRWFDKGKKIDKQEAFKWIKENKDRFSPEMIRYAQSFYKEEI